MTTAHAGAYKMVEAHIDRHLDRFDPYLLEDTYHDGEGQLTNVGGARSASAGDQGPKWQMSGGQRGKQEPVCGRAARRQRKNIRCSDGQELPYRDNPYTSKGKKKGRRARGASPSAQLGLVLGDSGLGDSLKGLSKKGSRVIKQTFNKVEKKRNKAYAAIAYHEKRGDMERATKAKAGAAALDSASDQLYRELDRRGLGAWAKDSSVKITDKDLRPGKRRVKAQAVAEALNLSMAAVDIAGLHILTTLLEQTEHEADPSYLAQQALEESFNG